MTEYLQYLPALAALTVATLNLAFDDSGAAYAKSINRWIITPILAVIAYALVHLIVS